MADSSAFCRYLLQSSPPRVVLNLCSTSLNAGNSLADGFLSLIFDLHQLRPACCRAIDHLKLITWSIQQTKALFWEQT